MNQLNSVILEGNLVEDVVVKDSVTGVKVAQFTIATSSTFKNRNGENAEEVSYFDIEAYGNMAEMLFNKLKKGRGVCVVGRLKMPCWKDDRGKSFSKVFVVAEHVDIKPAKE